MNKLLIICGPTGVGKTALAARLARELRGELVSADSRQIYRGMDIGTGKDRAEMGGIPVWMYDIVDPDEPFSVSDYQKLAKRAIYDIQTRGKLPIVVGGTGLYIQSLIQTIPTVGVKPNKELRRALGEKTIEELQGILKKTYSSVWEKMNASDRQNPHRLIRKIELAKAGITAIQKPSSYDYDVCWVGLTAPCTTHLYRIIDERVEKRLSQGILKEIHKLLDKGYPWSLPAFSSLGYGEWKGYFFKQQSMEEAVQAWKYHEHAYARRQMTWFRKNKAICWFDATQKGTYDALERAVRTWYTKNTYGIKD